MKYDEVKIGGSNIAHYIEAFRYIDGASEIKKDAEEIHEIVVKIRYLREKYSQKIGHIMDVSLVLGYVKEHHPDELQDIGLLQCMQDSILDELETRVYPLVSGNSESIVDMIEQARISGIIEQNKILKSILDTTSQGVWFIDGQFRVCYINTAICQMFGYTKEELKGHRLFDFFDQPEKEELISRASLMDVQEQRLYVLDLPRKDGTYLPVKIHATTIRLGDEIIGSVGFLTDISEFRNIEKRLKTEAITDELTGLYNRRFFDEKIENAIEKLNSGILQGVSLALFDIDYFKKINDTYGHATGDIVLKTIGTLLSSLQIKNISAFRYGGEEFALLGKNISREYMSLIAETLRKKIEEMQVQIPSKSPICKTNPGLDCPEPAHDKEDEKYVDGVVQCTISIGIETCMHVPGQLQTVRSLFVSADKYLYAAKAAGRNRVVSGIDISTKN